MFIKTEIFVPGLSQGKILIKVEPLFHYDEKAEYSSDSELANKSKLLVVRSICKCGIHNAGLFEVGINQIPKSDRGSGAVLPFLESPINLEGEEK